MSFQTIPDLCGFLCLTPQNKILVLKVLRKLLRLLFCRIFCVLFSKGFCVGNYSVVNLNGLERAIPEEETYVFYLLKSVISRQYLVVL